MELFQINATLAAIGYAMAAVLSKQALSRGAGILRLSFIVNLVFLPVFRRSARVFGDHHPV